MSALEPDTKRNWDPGGRGRIVSRRNDKIYFIVASAGTSDRSANDSMVDAAVQSRTDLDSHANMPVVGKNAYILAESGKTVDVSPFTPDYQSMEVPLVDAAILYECPHDGKSYVLVLRNALHVPSMEHNLVPPFMLREAGIVVNEVPKIQVTDPTKSDHAIIFP